MWGECSILSWVVGAASLVGLYLLADFLLRSLLVGGFTNKFVFITGCDTGFGRDLALHLDGLGFQVLAGCLTDSGATSLRQAASNRMLVLPLDVSKQDSLEQAIKTVKQRLPPDTGLWALVNNSGVGGCWAATELLDAASYQSVLSVNFLGLVEMTRLCLPLLRKGRGRVVNMASAAGLFAFVAAPYTCSKFAVEAYSDIIRREMRQYGIKVSVLEPGVHRTAIFNVDKMAESVKEAFDKSSPEIKAFYGPGVVQRYRQRFQSFYEGGCPSLSPVLEAYTHAVTARYPRRRYPIGTDCRLIFQPLTYLPTCFADWFVASQIYKGGV